MIERCRLIFAITIILLLATTILKLIYGEDSGQSNINAAITVQVFSICAFTLFYCLACHVNKSFANWIFVAFNGTFTVCILLYYLTDIGADLDTSGVTLLASISIFYIALCSLML